ncbi:MAG: glycosyltransferase [Balneola sp.]|nr:MAG: glycosyltransferase [Balneola sp.]
MIELSEEEIISNWYSDSIKVSICCITYNQEEYISNTLDGFLSQKTSFAFEILINDDASTDRNQEIIKSYEEKYPRLIKPIYQKENQRSKIGPVINVEFNYLRAAGDYIALCEGDDYWKDPNKLQKQYDFMEANQDCSVCFTAALYRNDAKPSKSFIKKPVNYEETKKYSLTESIYKAGDFMPTPTVFFRTKYAHQLPKWFYDSPVGDMPLSLFLGTVGKYGYLDFVGSVYRVNASSSWSSTMKFEKRRKVVQGLLKLLDEFNKYTEFEYQREVGKEKKRVIFNDRKSIVKRAISTSFIGKLIKKVIGDNNYHDKN